MKILTEANLRDAALTNTNLSGADLTGARCFSPEQAATAVIDENTRLPEFQSCV